MKEEWSSAHKSFCFDKESLVGLQKSAHVVRKSETLSAPRTWKCGAACVGVVLVYVGCRGTSWRLFCVALWPFLLGCVKFGGISAALCGVMLCFMSFGGSLQRCQWAQSLQRLAFIAIQPGTDGTLAPTDKISLASLIQAVALTAAYYPGNNLKRCFLKNRTGFKRTPLEYLPVNKLVPLKGNVSTLVSICLRLPQ